MFKQIHGLPHLAQQRETNVMTSYDELGLKQKPRKALTKLGAEEIQIQMN